MLIFAWASSETGNCYINDLNLSFNDVTDKCAFPGYKKSNSYSCVPGVLKQINIYLNSIKTINKSTKLNKDTLVFIFAGGNDVINNLLKIKDKLIPKIKNYEFLNSDIQNTKNKLNPDMNKLIISHPIKNTMLAVKLLVDNGLPAENIVIVNLPDLSLVPGIKQISKLKIVTEFVHLISAEYNQMLKFKLRHSIYKKVNIVNIYNFLRFLAIDKLNEFGIINSEGACTDNVKNLEVCDGYLFYNDKHPTLKVHKLIAQSVEECLYRWYPMQKFPFSSKHALTKSFKELVNRTCGF